MIPFILLRRRCPEWTYYHGPRGRTRRLWWRLALWTPARWVDPLKLGEIGKPGDSIRVEGSRFYDGLWTIDTVETNTIHVKRAR